MENKRQVGVIKFYSPRKRYGFITRPDGTDVFFHLSRFRSLSTPMAGSAVQFLEGRNAEGPTAEDIIVIPDSSIEYEVGLLDQLTLEGGVIIRENGQGQVKFLFKDFIPYNQVNQLNEGDEVEMGFLVEEEGGLRATVVRPLGYDPAAAGPPPRREGEEEEDNRRLLGVLYKTENGGEALEAARILCERNLRATLSALAGRALDPALPLSVRLELARLIPRIYLDEDSQHFLHAAADNLAQLLQEEPQPLESTVRAALEQLIGTPNFPTKWSQYLLPYGLTVLRALAVSEAFKALLGEGFWQMKLAQWMERAVQHVQQRRSGFSYVLTTSVLALDALWPLAELQPRLADLMRRLVPAADGSEWIQQLHFLRQRLSLPFVQALLPALVRHPEQSTMLRDAEVAEEVLGWLQQIRQEAEGRGDDPRGLFLEMLPTLDRLSQADLLREPLEEMMHPFWEGLQGEELSRLLQAGRLSDEALWPCLRHWEEQQALPSLLAEEPLRQHLVAWLRRVCGPPQGSFPRSDLRTVLGLIDRLRTYEELRPQLKEILEGIFADLRDRLKRADGPALPELLEQLEDAGLSGLAGVLAERIMDPSLTEMARRRLVGFLQRRGSPLSEVSARWEEYQRSPHDALLVSELYDAVQALQNHPESEVQDFVEVVKRRLEEDGVAVHDGFVVRIEPGWDGQERAIIEGYDIRLPRRLFLEPRDFAPNQYVRLVQRGGLALGVLRVPVPESQFCCGVLTQPLDIGDQGLIYGIITDGQDKTYYFEVSHITRGLRTALRVGDLMKMTRVPAPAGAATDFLAFNVQTEFTSEDVPLLWEALETAQNGQVREACWRQLWRLLPAEGEPADLRSRLQDKLWEMDEEARSRCLASLNEEERAEVEQREG